MICELAKNLLCEKQGEVGPIRRMPPARWGCRRELAANLTSHGCDSRQWVSSALFCSSLNRRRARYSLTVFTDKLSSALRGPHGLARGDHHQRLVFAVGKSCNAVSWFSPTLLASSWASEALMLPSPPRPGGCRHQFARRALPARRPDACLAFEHLATGLAMASATQRPARFFLRPAEHVDAAAVGQGGCRAALPGISSHGTAGWRRGRFPLRRQR